MRMHSQSHRCSQWSQARRYFGRAPLHKIKNSLAQLAESRTSLIPPAPHCVCVCVCVCALMLMCCPPPLPDACRSAALPRRAPAMRNRSHATQPACKGTKMHRARTHRAGPNAGTNATTREYAIHTERAATNATAIASNWLRQPRTVWRLPLVDSCVLPPPLPDACRPAALP